MLLKYLFIFIEIISYFGFFPSGSSSCFLSTFRRSHLCHFQVCSWFLVLVCVLDIRVIAWSRLSSLVLVLVYLSVRCFHSIVFGCFGMWLNRLLPVKCLVMNLILINWFGSVEDCVFELLYRSRISLAFLIIFLVLCWP